MITIVRLEDVFDVIGKKYLYKAYQVEPSGRNIRWRVNGRVQPTIDSSSVAFPETSIERLNKILH